MSDFDKHRNQPYRQRCYGISSRKTNQKREQFVSNWKNSSEFAPDFRHAEGNDLQNQWLKLNDQMLQFQQEQANFAEEQFKFFILQITAMNQSLFAQFDLQFRNWACHYHDESWTQASANDMDIPSEPCQSLPRKEKISKIYPILDPISEEVEQTHDGETVPYFILSIIRTSLERLLKLMCSRRFVGWTLRTRQSHIADFCFLASGLIHSQISSLFLMQIRKKKNGNPLSLKFKESF